MDTLEIKLLGITLLSVGMFTMVCAFARFCATESNASATVAIIGAACSMGGELLLKKFQNVKKGVK